MAMTNLRILSLLALGWVGCLFPLDPALAENRIALVIGNSSYETVTVLPNPANDAKAMTDLLTEAGFEVVAAPNLTQTEMRQAISNFAAMVSAKGRDTVALVFYAGHGLQVDGENFLVPVDARIQREADVPLQAMRLSDVVNALAAVPSTTRLFILDACRNNPFSEINKTGGRGLAIVDAPSGSLVSYSTAPGSEAQDGDGANSPFTAGIVQIAHEPGVPIEQALKRVRLLVHQATNSQQTPWESSSLTGDFYFFPGQAQATPRPTPASSDVKLATAGGDTAAATGRAGGTRVATRSTDEWRRDFRSRQPAEAYDLVIQDGSVEAFDAYLSVYSVAPYAPRVRSLLERRREMMAWYTAVTINTVASFEAFLARYGNSDLAETARRLMERARNRSLASLDPVTPTCACSLPAPPAPQKKTEKSKKEPKKGKHAKRSTPEREKKKSTRGKTFVSDDEVARSGGGPRPAGSSGGGGGGGAPPISIGIGIGGGGFGGGRSHSVPSGGTRPMGGHYR
jgi:uncharacterized caspase-like protein